MFEFESPTCPVCDTTETLPILEINAPRDQSFISPKQNVACCAQCGLVMLNPRHTMNTYQQFYSSRNTSKLESMSPSELVKSQGTRNIYRQYFNDVVKNLAPQTRDVLDVGAGLGLFAHFLAEDGFTAEILEPSSTAVAYAQKNFNLKGYVGFIEQNDITKKYDALTMTALIEHLLDPRAALRSMRELLKPDGILYLCTPDIEESVPHVSLNSTFTFQHVYNFSLNTLTALLSREGFEVIHSFRDPAVKQTSNYIYPGNFLNGRLHVVAKRSAVKSAQETAQWWDKPAETRSRILAKVHATRDYRFFAHRKDIQRFLQSTIGKLIRRQDPMKVRAKNYHFTVSK